MGRWAIEYFNLEGSTTNSRYFREHLRRRLADPYLMLENWRGRENVNKMPNMFEDTVLKGRVLGAAEDIVG